jgi:hypothetical protein
VIRVISSADGEHWGPSSLISSPGADLRDPKLSLTPDRRLMLTAAARYQSSEISRFQTLTWFSLDGRDWAEPFKIGDPDMWLWRVNWHRGNAYSIGYSTATERFIRLYVGPQGMRFERVSDKIYDEATPTEATLLLTTTTAPCAWCAVTPAPARPCSGAAARPIAPGSGRTWARA